MRNATWPRSQVSGFGGDVDLQPTSRSGLSSHRFLLFFRRQCKLKGLQRPHCLPLPEDPRARGSRGGQRAVWVPHVDAFLGLRWQYFCRNVFYLKDFKPFLVKIQIKSESKRVFNNNNSNSIIIKIIKNDSRIWKHWCNSWLFLFLVITAFQVTQARERNRNRKLASLFHSKKKWGSAEDLAPIEEERTASHQLVLPAFRPRKFSRWGTPDDFWRSCTSTSTLRSCIQSKLVLACVYLSTRHL